MHADGNFDLLHVIPGKYPLIFIRKSGKQKILVAINPSAKPVRVRLENRVIKSAGELLMGNGARIVADSRGLQVLMDGVSYGIFSVGLK